MMLVLADEPSARICVNSPANFGVGLQELEVNTASCLYWRERCGADMASLMISRFHCA